MFKQKATIFGGNGFIGSHLSTRLIAMGWDCYVPDRGATYDEKKNLGYVFYCAGLTADYISRPFDTVEAHVALLSKILQANRFESLVYLSSTRLYDSQPENFGTEELSLLLNPSNPRHIYDLSKALGESLCCVTGMGKARVARLSCVYNNHTDHDGFLPWLLRQIIEGPPALLKVDSSPAFSRDYIHLEDVLDALIMIALQGKEFIYNVASGENISNENLFTTITEASGCKIVPLRFDNPPSPPQISIQKIHNEFSLRPIPVLKKIISILDTSRIF